jgi:hypothetical protein
VPAAAVVSPGESSKVSNSVMGRWWPRACMGTMVLICVCAALVGAALRGWPLLHQLHYGPVSDTALKAQGTGRRGRPGPGIQVG